MPIKNITYKIERKNIKNPRLQFKTGELILHLPYEYKEEQALLLKHKNWILKKAQYIRDCRDIASKIVLNDQTFLDFKKIAEHLIKQHDLNNKITGLSFRRFKNRWAGIDSKNHITLNKKMIFLPHYLTEYIIYHEIMHTIEKKHNARFKELIKNKFKNYKLYDKELFACWLLIS